MIPLIPALVLAFVSFLASAFVILRIIVPILPPSPLSRRVSPAEFGLPTFRSLSPADKGHLWLAGFDIVAIFVFVWHVTAEATSGPVGAAIAQDSLSTIRLWFIMTARQGCLLMIAGLALLHIRIGRSFSFGQKHWMLWGPVILLAITSTALAGVLAGAGVNGLYPGLAAYTGTFAVLTTISFAWLFVTLFAIKKNLASLNEDQDCWLKSLEAKSRPSLGTEDIDAIEAIRDGESWVTSTAGGSRRNSVGAWSFSTHQTAVGSSHHGHTGRPSSRNGSVPNKSSFWFATVNNDDFIPPVPPLPTTYGLNNDRLDPDPFRRDVPALSSFPRGRLGSQTSWMTSTDGTRTTLPAWDFPPSIRDGSVYNESVQDLQTAVSRPATPGLATAQVLGGYGFVPNMSAEKGLASLAAPADAEIHLSIRPIIGWFISIWLPFALAIPYFIILTQQATVSTPIYILYVLSVTLSAPLLALNVIFGSALPIPTGLFDIRETPSPASLPNRMSTAPSELPRYKWSHEYKRSMSTTPTVVEGRRSGDVWIAKGDAMDGKSKLGRAISMLSPNPKLSVMPPEEDEEVPPTPPIPYHEGDSSIPIHVNHNRSHSETSAQFGRLGTESSKGSSKYTSTTGGVEAKFVSKIMVAQRHYSTLAQTVLVPAGSSQEKKESPVGSATGVITQRRTSGSHLRTRSTSSISGPQTSAGSSYNSISPPPSFPLPPTPPNVRAARLAQMSHKKSFSSNYSFSPVDDMNEIDALSAGVLPLLVPGLKLGQEMKIKEGDYSPPATFSKSKGRKIGKQLKEFGEDFSSPEVHSTPARRHPRARKDSHKSHFSLPSLSLGKEGLQTFSNWSNDIRVALENKVGQYMAVPSQVDLGQRNTVYVVESVPVELSTVQEEPPRGASLGRSHSTRSLGLRADVPHNIDTARNSLMTIEESPPSAASTVTLFEEFEAGLVENPQSHSTPHSTIAAKPTRQVAPPVPNKRSSITYIRSDEPTSSVTNFVPASAPSAMSSITQWSARTVQPLIPKTGSFKRKNDSSNAKGGSPKEGLRQLSLLQERNTNSLESSSPDSTKSGSIRPLTLGKRQKRALATASANDENAVPDSIDPARQESEAVEAR